MASLKFQLLLISSVFILYNNMQVERQQLFINATVSKDGPQDYKNISAAIRAAPMNSKQRFIIKIKAGLYRETVTIGPEKKRITLIGEGMSKTIIVGSKAVGSSKLQSYDTATLEIYGSEFVAMNLTVENDAVPEKMQAVAVRSDVDSAFYRCKFLGYQDTVLANKNRQFYRECHIYGTIDFVWGNAAMVMQHCEVFVRKPLSYQYNVITAQGRVLESEKTGIVFHLCNINPTSELEKSKTKFQTYLGRPWKTFSRVVIIKSSIGGFINPEGWIKWDNQTQTDKVYYAEYKNRGLGSSTRGRVHWPGVKNLTKPSEVNKFSVRNFIQGQDWINSTGVPFLLDL